MRVQAYYIRIIFSSTLPYDIIITSSLRDSSKKNLMRTLQYRVMRGLEKAGGKGLVVDHWHLVWLFTLLACLVTHTERHRGTMARWTPLSRCWHPGKAFMHEVKRNRQNCF
jgi:hypothetical protein